MTNTTDPIAEALSRRTSFERFVLGGIPSTMIGIFAAFTPVFDKNPSWINVPLMLAAACNLFLGGYLRGKYGKALSQTKRYGERVENRRRD